jgi:hypothetical protein
MFPFDGFVAAATTSQLQLLKVTVRLLQLIAYRFVFLGPLVTAKVNLANAQCQSRIRLILKAN